MLVFGDSAEVGSGRTMLRSEGNQLLEVLVEKLGMTHCKGAKSSCKARGNFLRTVTFIK